MASIISQAIDAAKKAAKESALQAISGAKGEVVAAAKSAISDNPVVAQVQGITGTLKETVKAVADAPTTIATSVKTIVADEVDSKIQAAAAASSNKLGVKPTAVNTAADPAEEAAEEEYGEEEYGEEEEAASGGGMSLRRKTYVPMYMRPRRKVVPKKRNKRTKKIQKKRRVTAKKSKIASRKSGKRRSRRS